MTLSARVQTEDVEGVVESVNATGLKLGGAWLNVSRFRPITLPDAGAHVRLKVDPKGYIVELETLSSPSLPSADRDTRISRLAVLKAAAAFGASRPDMKSSDVLRVADAWLAWVESA